MCVCVSASGYARSGQILLWDQVGSEYLLGATEKRSVCLRHDARMARCSYIRAGTDLSVSLPRLDTTGLGQSVCGWIRSGPGFGVARVGHIAAASFYART